MKKSETTTKVHANNMEGGDGGGGGATLKFKKA